MKNQPNYIQLKNRVAVIKRALIEAGAEGTTSGHLHDLVLVLEPTVTRKSLALWIAMNQRRLQAVRGLRTGHGFMWYHRGAMRKASAPVRRGRRATSQRRAVTVTLPALPRLTLLGVYSVLVTVYAAALTALKVLAAL
jgi:hypothetical protein